MLGDKSGIRTPCRCTILFNWPLRIETRTAQPRTLASLAVWDALLVDVLKRLRCSQCGKRQCSATVRPETKRDG